MNKRESIPSHNVDVETIMASTEYKRENKGIHLGIPSSRILFETINIFLQLSNHRRVLQKYSIYISSSRYPHDERHSSCPSNEFPNDE